MMIPLLSLVLLPGVTPGKTLRAFLDALNAHDSTALRRQVLGAVDGEFPFSNAIPKVRARFDDAKVDGDEATLEVDTEFADGRNDGKYHETVHFRRVDGDWRIVPIGPQPGANKPQPLSMLAFIATKPGAFNLVKTASKKTVDLSNVKQVALATLMYAGDHHDRLPTAKGFRVAILPYLRNAEILTAPNAPRGTTSYFLDPRLSGLLMTSVPSPAETAMILEGTPAKTAFPWSGKTPLGYMDGHVKIVDATQVFKARKFSLK